MIPQQSDVPIIMTVPYESSSRPTIELGMLCWGDTIQVSVYTYRIEVRV